MLLVHISKFVLHKLPKIGQITRNLTIFKVLRRSVTIDTNTNVIKDVILYKYENPKFFKTLNIFAFCQFGFWSYLSFFALTTLKDIPASESQDAEWWKKINLGESKFKNSLSIISFVLGFGVLSISWLYTLRSVRYLVLHKGGSKLSFVTYTPLGANRIMTVPLENVSCRESRLLANSQLPIKIKNRFMHYILDMKGEFKNNSLFDSTAGLKRTFK